MRRMRSSYPPEFRQQLVELVWASSSKISSKECRRLFRPPRNAGSRSCSLARTEAGQIDRPSLLPPAPLRRGNKARIRPFGRVHQPWSGRGRALAAPKP